MRTYVQETVGVSESAIMARFGNAGKEISKTQGTTAKSLLARRIDGCYEPPKLGRYHAAGVAIKKALACLNMLTLACVFCHGQW